MVSYTTFALSRDILVIHNTLSLKGVEVSFYFLSQYYYTNRDGSRKSVQRAKLYRRVTMKNARAEYDDLKKRLDKIKQKNTEF